jgi:hypothetical protein
MYYKAAFSRESVRLLNKKAKSLTDPFEKASNCLLQIIKPIDLLAKVTIISHRSSVPRARSRIAARTAAKSAAYRRATNLAAATATIRSLTRGSAYTEREGDYQR